MCVLTLQSSSRKVCVLRHHLKPKATRKTSGCFSGVKARRVLRAVLIALGYQLNNLRFVLRFCLLETKALNNRRIINKELEAISV